VHELIPKDVMDLEDPDMHMSCISNALREDMLAAMKEFIARKEGRFEEIDFSKKQ
jgi:hypothetical protein